VSGTPKTSNSVYWNGEIPWLSVADFNTGMKYVSFTEKTISEKGLNESSTKLFKAGDIIISARGTVGVVAVLNKPMAFN
jgi:type I restriction enzyme S subunit